MNKSIDLIMQFIFYGVLLGVLISNSNDIEKLQATIDNLKPVDDCAWLYPDGKRGAVVYNRFDNEITIQCKRGKK